MRALILTRTFFELNEKDQCSLVKVRSCDPEFERFATTYFKKSNKSRLKKALESEWGLRPFRLPLDPSLDYSLYGLASEKSELKQKYVLSPIIALSFFKIDGKRNENETKTSG